MNYYLDIFSPETFRRITFSIRWNNLKDHS